MKFILNRISRDRSETSNFFQKRRNEEFENFYSLKIQFNK